jgi:hypothetical protein
VPPDRVDQVNPALVLLESLRPGQIARRVELQRADTPPPSALMPATLHRSTSPKCGRPRATRDLDVDGRPGRSGRGECTSAPVHARVDQRHGIPRRSGPQVREQRRSKRASCRRSSSARPMSGSRLWRTRILPVAENAHRILATPAMQIQVPAVAVPSDSSWRSAPSRSAPIPTCPAHTIRIRKAVHEAEGDLRNLSVSNLRRWPAIDAEGDV